MIHDIKKLNAAIDTIGDLCCRELPEDWQLEIHMLEDEMSFTLLDHEGEEVEFDHVDERTAAEMLLDMVSYARQCDGLDNPETTDDYTPEPPRQE